MYAFNVIRQVILKGLDLAQDRQCVIDSLPLPVVQFYLVPGSTGDWRAFQATYGKVPSKKQTIFGFKLHLLITLGGLILDFELAPANVTDLEVGFEMLSEHTDLSVLGDKAYISAEKAAELFAHNRIRLMALPRRNQKAQLPAESTHFSEWHPPDDRNRQPSAFGDIPNRNQSRSYLLGPVYQALYQVDSTYVVHLHQSFVGQTRVLADQVSGFSQLA